MAELTLDQVLSGVAHEWERKGNALNAKADSLENAHDIRGAAKVRARAAEWLNYGNYAGGKGVFPINGSDNELSLGWAKERSLAMKAGAFINLNAPK